MRYPLFKKILEDKIKTLKPNTSDESNEDFQEDYSRVRVDVCNNTIYLEDTNDGSLIAINPDCWDLIKDTVDQWIEDGHLEDGD